MEESSDVSHAEAVEQMLAVGTIQVNVRQGKILAVGTSSRFFDPTKLPPLGQIPEKVLSDDARSHQVTYSTVPSMIASKTDHALG